MTNGIVYVSVQIPHDQETRKIDIEDNIEQKLNIQINEVNYFKVRNEWPLIRAAKLKAKSLVAKLGMQWCKIEGRFS